MIDSPRPEAAPESADGPNDLRALLEDAPYIEDAGFSARVVTALPRRRALSYTVIPAFALLGCLLAYLLSNHTRGSEHTALALSVVTTWSFAAGAMALLLVAWATLLTAEE
jgi:hypothetical protein